LSFFLYATNVLKRAAAHIHTQGGYTEQYMNGAENKK
jgi:hypothetical protein